LAEKKHFLRCKLQSVTRKHTITTVKGKPVFKRAVSSSRSRIPLNDGIEFILRDGSVVRIAPGPYGKGISILPLPSRGAKPTPPSANGHEGAAAKRGRKPRPSTSALREKLAKESETGGLNDPPHYVQWLLEQDAEVGLAMARTIVYREMKKFR
jgi:hypothetical protein